MTSWDNRHMLAAVLIYVGHVWAYNIYIYAYKRDSGPRLCQVAIATGCVEPMWWDLEEIWIVQTHGGENHPQKTWGTGMANPIPNCAQVPQPRAGWFSVWQQTCWSRVEENPHKSSPRLPEGWGRELTGNLKELHPYNDTGRSDIYTVCMHLYIYICMHVDYISQVHCVCEILIWFGVLIWPCILRTSLLVFQLLSSWMVLTMYAVYMCKRHSLNPLKIISVPCAGDEAIPCLGFRGIQRGDRHNCRRFVPSCGPVRFWRWVMRQEAQS